MSSKSGAQPDIFQGRGSFVELRHFDKYFIKNTRKKGSAGKNSGFFTGTFKQKLGTIKAFFSEIKGVFSILKQGYRRLPPPHLLRVNLKITALSK